MCEALSVSLCFVFVHLVVIKSGFMSNSLTCFTFAAGDETLQFMQQLSSSARSEADEWSLMLTSDKPQPSSEVQGTWTSVQLTKCFLP